MDSEYNGIYIFERHYSNYVEYVSSCPFATVEKVFQGITLPELMSLVLTWVD